MISILMTTYNRCDLIPRALNSIARLHTTCPYEVVVIDDGSTDETEKVVCNYKKQKVFPLVYIKRSKNSEDEGNEWDPVNEGFETARGKYICHLDDDDIYRKHRLNIPYLALKHNSDIDLVYCDSLIKGYTTRRDSSKHFDARRLQRYNYIRKCETMYRREVYDKVGPFKRAFKSRQEDGPRAGDWDFLKRVSEAKFKFFHIPIVLCEVFEQGTPGYGDLDASSTELTEAMTEKKFHHQNNIETFKYEDFYD